MVQGWKIGVGISIESFIVLLALIIRNGFNVSITRLDGKNTDFY